MVQVLCNNGIKKFFPGQFSCNFVTSSSNRRHTVHMIRCQCLLNQNYFCDHHTCGWVAVRSLKNVGYCQSRIFSRSDAIPGARSTLSEQSIDGMYPKWLLLQKHVIVQTFGMFFCWIYQRIKWLRGRLLSVNTTDEYYYYYCCVISTACWSVLVSGWSEGWLAPPALTWASRAAIWAQPDENCHAQWLQNCDRWIVCCRQKLVISELWRLLKIHPRLYSIPETQLVVKGLTAPLPKNPILRCQSFGPWLWPLLERVPPVNAYHF